MLAALAVLSVETAAHAQLPQARLYSIFPCGAKAGTTVDVTLTSFADLDALDRLVVQHARHHGRAQDANRRRAKEAGPQRL